MIISTNIQAMNAHRNLKSVGRKNAAASERLSSGLRINSAADDAAGLAISEKMKAQIKGLQQAERNTQDGINLIKTMEGGMENIQEMMTRQRELIIQALNDTNTDEDRAKIQVEIDELTAEIGSVSERVTFNNIPLLNVGDDNDQSATFAASSAMQSIMPLIEPPLTTLLPSEIEGLSTANPIGYYNGTSGIDSDETAVALTTADGLSILWSRGFAIRATDTESNTQVSFATSRVLDNSTITNGPASFTQLPLTDPYIGMAELVFNSNGITFSLIQKVSVVVDADSLEYYNLEFELVNNSGKNLDIDLMFIGDTDYFHTSGPGVWSNPLTNTPTITINNSQVTTYDSTNSGGIPGTIDVSSNDNATFSNSPTQAVITGDGIINPPDRVVIGDVSTMESSHFNYTPTPGTGDMGYGVYWNNISLGVGSSSTVNILHGGISGADPPDRPDPPDPPDSAYTQTHGDLWIQCGANSGQGMFINRYDCRPEALFEYVFDPNTITIEVDGVPKEITLKKLVTSPWEEANASLIALDAVFGKISSYRATAGAQQNRLEFTDNFLAVAYTNLEDANSRIADADMAKEMMDFTKSNVLQQAAIAVLAQARQAPESVLQLLQ